MPGAAIGPSVRDVSTNHGMVVGAEDRNSLLDKRIVLSQTAFCGRAMRAPTFSPCSMDIGLDADMPPYGIGIGSGAGIPAICEKGIEMVINNRPTFHAWGHLAVVGTAIGRPSVTVSANYGMVVGAEDRNNLLVERIVLSQIAFCGRAMRAPTVSSSVPSTRHGIGIKKDTGMVIGVRQFITDSILRTRNVRPYFCRHAAWALVQIQGATVRDGHWYASYVLLLTTSSVSII